MTITHVGDMRQIHSTVITHEEKVYIGSLKLIRFFYEDYPMTMYLMKKQDEWLPAKVDHSDVSYEDPCPFCVAASDERCDIGTSQIQRVWNELLNAPAFRLRALYEL